MEINVSSEQGRVPVSIFSLVGDLDTSTYDQLQNRARQEIDAGVRFIVLDLAQVPYVSSWGIRAISQVYKWLQEASADETGAAVSQGVRDGSYRSAHLKIVNPAPQVRRVLTETGLDMFVEMDSDLKKAVASF